jgi:hypothetical protein
MPVSFTDATPHQSGDTKRVTGRVYIYETGHGWLDWQAIRQDAVQLHLALVQAIQTGKTIDSVVDLITDHPDVALPAFFDACTWQGYERGQDHPGAPIGWASSEPVETWAQSILNDLPCEMQDRLSGWGCEVLGRN